MTSHAARERPARRRNLALVGGVAALCLVVLAVVVVRALGGGDGSKTTTYDALTTQIANPERGWSDRIDTITDQRDFSESVDAGVTLLHSYVRLDDFRTTDISAELLDQLGEGLDAVRESHLKIILRFAYNAGPYPNSEPDASLQQVLRHIDQVAPVLQAHADVIAGIEAGFIGAWGEWHTSTNGLDTDESAKRQILKAERASFPGDLMLRYPADLRALDAVSPDRTDGSDDLDGSVGAHLDCFLASVPDDNGTFGRDGSSPEDDKALVAEAGSYAMVGGETCNSSPPPDRTNCTVALDELAQQHFTYLNRDYEPNSLAALDDCRTEIGDRLGYRLELTSATYPDQLSGRDLPVTLVMKNVGFASLVAERPAYVVVTCGNQTQRVALDSDPRSWDPGADQTITQDLTLPEAPSRGSCDVGLAMPDAADELADDPAYAVQLASSTTWRDGVNYFATVSVTGS